MAGLWGVPAPPWPLSENDTVYSSTSPTRGVPSLAEQLAQYPSILGLSLLGNLQPTVDFYNRTGYIHLNDHWQLVEASTNSTRLRGRDLAMSLYNRLLPRWHFYLSRRQQSADATAVTSKLPLHVLVATSDAGFCQWMGLPDDREYNLFKRESIPRLKFSSQFDIWLKTGRPIGI